ncbi:aldehyde dehydrogenase family protein [Mesorhizobium sp. M0590]|uniref:aldehyde dehydrogenase family protein n=1 Tax=Mesorhizobium sp. M0590 TaxID=2956966 RepID=UPI00333AFD3C
MSVTRTRPYTVRDRLVVLSPFDGVRVGEVEVAHAGEIGELLARARQGACTARGLPRHRRAAILEGAARLVEDRIEAFAQLIVSEAGKTIVQARKEVRRCINTLKLSADEAKRNAGEVVPFDAYAGSEARQGWFTREPLGIIVAITPYNDPLNLVAHKLGPAIAGGNAVLLKPSELAPLSALRIIEALHEAGLPPDVVTAAVGGQDLGEALVQAREVRMISFTGGFATGERISRTAGLKKLTMDLGGNAPVIVMADCDFQQAVDGCISGSYWAAGQNCIGVQRILVQRPIYDRFANAFVNGSKRLKVGDPLLEDTDIGPMISAEAAMRAEERVAEAISAGATVLYGNQRRGSLYYPTILADTPVHCLLWQEEVFAPVVTLTAFDSLDEAIALANDTEYSLHAGIFTNSLPDAMNAASRIDAAGLMINDSSDYRFDGMPFGGYKYGSMGREGVRFAYEDMTQTKVVCINRVETRA